MDSGSRRNDGSGGGIARDAKSCVSTYIYGGVRYVGANPCVRPVAGNHKDCPYITGRKEVSFQYWKDWGFRGVALFIIDIL